MNILKNISDNVEERRKALGLSVEKLSRKADISLSALNKIRRNVPNYLRIDTVYNLAKALGCSMDDLVMEPCEIKVGSIVSVNGNYGKWVVTEIPEVPNSNGKLLGIRSIGSSIASFTVAYSKDVRICK